MSQLEQHRDPNDRPKYQVDGYACPEHAIADIPNGVAAAVFCRWCLGTGMVDVATLNLWQYEQDKIIANGGNPL